MNNYYTYAYLRKDGTPYYIGKGKDDRISSKQRSINSPKDKSRIIFLKQNLLEEEAFKHEIYMIAVFGRKDLGTGILHNKTNGGEGTSGRIITDDTRNKIKQKNKGKKLTDEHKRKISKANKGKSATWNIGKKHSIETRKKISEALKGKVTWNIGRKHSIETKEKLSKAHKGKKLTDEHKRKIGEKSKGRKHTEETKKKISEMFIGHYITEETKRKISKTLLGNKNALGNKNVSGTSWWTDGKNNKRSVECPGDCWVKGMITHKDASTPVEIILRNKLGHNKTHIVSKERSEISKRIVKKTNSQKWMCLETGFVTTSGPLTLYQTKRGIDTSRRKKIA